MLQPAPAAHAEDDHDDDHGPIVWRHWIPDQEPRDAYDDDVFVTLADSAANSNAIANIVGVALTEAGKIYDYDAQNSHFLREDQVIVEFDHQEVVARVVIPSSRRPIGHGSQGPLPAIIRRATEDDIAARREYDDRAQDLLSYARDRVRSRNLPIKMVRAEFAPGGQRATVHFASEERVDFRDLVRDLGTKFRGRIEMRQIGARDEAKLVGGIGSCGRELCCSTFLPRFEPVSIKHAKEQNLPLNPSKVTGQCGRLKCCLVYESQTYREMGKGLPKVGKRVITPAGNGKVAELDVLRQRIRVWFDEGGSEVFPANVVQAMFPPQEQGRKGEGEGRRDKGQKQAADETAAQSDESDSDGDDTLPN